MEISLTDLSNIIKYIGFKKAVLYHVNTPAFSTSLQDDFEVNHQVVLTFYFENNFFLNIVFWF